METTTSCRANKVLIVDDDPSFRGGLRASLKKIGYSAQSARNGQEALAYVREHPVDIVLLDINMPGMSGVEACRRIRADAPLVVIVMLTIRDAMEDKVLALDAGADDYVTKPFNLPELTARIRAILRRRGGEAAAQAPILRAGDLELDVAHRLLYKAGREIHLSPREFDLLEFLMQHMNVPVTHTRILRTIWGPEYGDEPEYLRSYVKMLRKKLEDNPADPEYILTEPWVGYRFRDPSDPDATRPSLDADDGESE